MATTTVALGKVEIRDREERQCPAGWGGSCVCGVRRVSCVLLATDFWGAADKAGHPTNDPKDVLGGGGLLYLGGEEETGGYKGYGLALMVELFTGILSGADYGANIPPWRQGRGRCVHFSYHRSKAHHHLCADRTHARTRTRTHVQGGQSGPVLRGDQPGALLRRIPRANGRPHAADAVPPACRP